MKRLLIWILMLCVNTYLFTQTRGSSLPMSFHISREGVPAVLNVVDGSVHFTDNDGNNVINAGEKCAIFMTVENTGSGDASGCVAHVLLNGTKNGLTCEDISLPIIPHGEKYELTIPIIASHDIQTGQAEFYIEIHEPHGFGIEPIMLTVPTQEFLAPCVEVVSQQVLTANHSDLTKKMPFTLRVVVQNTNQGVAEQVQIDLREPKNILLTSGNAHTVLASLKPNETVTLDFDLISTINAADDIPFQIALSEKYGKYAHNKTIDLHFGQPTGMTTNYTIQGNLHQNVEITPYSLVSDVDKDIPYTNIINNNTFVLIISNEHYLRTSSVPFAINDGKVFKEYCEKTLGVPQLHVRSLSDATYNQIRLAINWLSSISEAFKEVNIIVYYTGHGIPDESNRSAYLLPIDGDGSDVATGYKLDDMYEKLGKMSSKSITVFLDACFSGATREGGMITQTKGVALIVRQGVPQGNTVVFSASQGDQTAGFYEKQGHGLFTYYLLKKLQETKGNVSLKDLGEYITTNVKQQSIVQNGKIQTPTITPSISIGTNWQDWRLK